MANYNGSHCFIKYRGQPPFLDVSGGNGRGGLRGGGGCWAGRWGKAHCCLSPIRLTGLPIVTLLPTKTSSWRAFCRSKRHHILNCPRFRSENVKIRWLPPMATMAIGGVDALYSNVWAYHVPPIAVLGYRNMFNGD